MADELEISQIETDYSQDRQLLEQQIDHITLIEHKLNDLILDLESANLHLKTLLRTEKDINKKKSLHTAISFNIEKLTKLYSVLREYQDTKFKYINAINDNSFRKNRLIYHDLQKKSSNDNFAFFNQLMGMLNNNQPKLDQFIEAEDEIENYKV